MPRMMRFLERATVIAAALVMTNIATGQASQRAAFVANNGNLEGSVTAYRIEADGSLTFVNRIVTGTRTSTTLPCSGCNAYSISITPNGKYVATGHAAGDAPLPDGITIFNVASDAAITQIYHLPLTLPSSPLAVRWINDQYLAVTRTSTTSANNGLAVYAFNPLAPSLTEIDTESINGFSGYLEVHPSRQYLYAQSTGPNAMILYQVNGNGTLTYISSYPISNYPLGPGISPDGTRLYAASGGSGNVITGWDVNTLNGTLAMMPGSPFPVPSSSPKQVVVSRDGLFAFAGYGSSGVFRNFSIDQSTGALTYLGFTQSAGTTGSLGEIAVLDNLLLVTDRDTISDGVRGLLSFTIGSNGSLTQNGLIVSSQGITPNAVAGWKPPPPPCPADVNADHSVNVSDLLAVINGWGPCPGRCPPYCTADINHDCSVNVSDLLAVINAWGPCPH